MYKIQVDLALRLSFDDSIAITSLEYVDLVLSKTVHCDDMLGTKN